MTNGTNIKTTDYLDGFQYNEQVLEFFPTTEGYVKATPTGLVPPGTPPSAYAFNYVFNYTDHLGNVRVSYTKDPQTGNLKILDESHYYPFGLKHQEYSTFGFVSNPIQGVIIAPLTNNPYQYKYNGKEFQDELGLGLYDYGARNYDAAIGRWMNYDPLAEQMRRHSPYSYAFDNPIYFIDPDGMAGKDFTILIAKEGAQGYGHMAAVIQDGEGNYYYVTMGATEDGGLSKMSTSGVDGGMAVMKLDGVDSMEGAINMAKQDTNNSAYTDHITFETSSEQDQKIFEATTEKADLINSGQEKYNVLSNNCTDAVERPIEKATGASLPNKAIPNANYDKLIDNKDKIQGQLKEDANATPINKDNNPGALKAFEQKI